MPHDFDPGPGWRRKTDDEPLRGPYVHIGADEDDEGVFWVREEPVPPLPTEPYTVIRVLYQEPEREGWTEDVWHLLKNRLQWLSSSGEYAAADQIRQRITGFEVLAEPRGEVVQYADLADGIRRETAKAVVDWLRGEAWASAHADDVACEFGVES